MERLSTETRRSLISAIAERELTAKELSTIYGIPVPDLRTFVAENTAAILAERRRLDEPESEAELTPENLDGLWITKKYERLKRLQDVADETYKTITMGDPSVPEMAIVVREFRSYLMLAANELGQLLHRGSGDSGTDDTLSVEITGVDMESLR